jgi:hypothetical protein
MAENLPLCSESIDDGLFSWRNLSNLTFSENDWLVRHQSLCTILMFVTKGQFRSVGACMAM